MRLTAACLFMLLVGCVPSSSFAPWLLGRDGRAVTMRVGETLAGQRRPWWGFRMPVGGVVPCLVSSDPSVLAVKYAQGDPASGDADLVALREGVVMVYVSNHLGSRGVSASELQAQGGPSVRVEVVK
jgi:hypothetical protein